MSNQLYNEVDTFYYTAGDTLNGPKLLAQDADGQPKDLTGYTAVLRMRGPDPAETLVITNEAAVIDSATAGKVSFTPSATMQALAVGTYWYKWRLTRTSDGKNVLCCCNAGSRQVDEFSVGQGC